MIGQKHVILSERSGGIEKHVAEIGSHLVRMGHDVCIYARAQYSPDRPAHVRGMHMVYIATVYVKWLETIVHAFLSTLHAIWQKYDIIHYHGVGPATLAWIPRIFARRATVIVTFHSRDQFHQKWGMFARRYLAFGERAAATFPHYCIAVSHIIQVYCRETFKREVVFIPNGSTVKQISKTDQLEQFDIEPGKYILNVGRIVPQKGLQYLIKAFSQIKTDMSLVIVGTPSFSNAYFAELKALAKGNDRIIFAGFQTGETLEQLFAHAYLYCQPSESEGLPVVVLESMSYGTPVLVSDIPENIEAMQHTGFTFVNRDVDDLAEQLTMLLHRADVLKEKGEEAQAVIDTEYNWKRIAEKTEGVYITARH